MSGRPIARLRTTYLLGGMPDASGGLAEGSLRLLANRMFLLPNHQLLALVGTDDRGLIRKFDSTFAAKEAVQLPPNDPLLVDVLPADAVRHSLLGFGDAWQVELVAEARAHPKRGIMTLPVLFRAKHLVPPLPGDENARKIHDDLAKLGDLAGQLLPQPRVFIVLFQQGALAHPPSELGATVGDRKVRLARLAKTVALEVRPGKAVRYEAYTSTEPQLEPGRYVVSVPRGAFAARYRQGPTSRTFEVAFGVDTLAGQFDFHVFELPSAESAILTHFPDLFPHLLEPEDSRVDAAAAPAPTFAEAEAPTTFAVATRLVAEHKAKLAAGWINAKDVAGLPDLFKASLAEAAGEQVGPPTAKQALKGGAKTALVKRELLRNAGKELLGTEPPQGWRSAATFALDAWGAGEQGYLAWESWQKIKLARKHRDILAACKQAADAHGLRRFFARTLYRDAALVLLEAHQAGEYNAISPVVAWKAARDPAAIDRALAKTVSTPIAEFHACWLNKAQHKIAFGLDTAMSVTQLVGTIAALGQLRESEQVSLARVAKYTDEYAKAYAGKPCLAAVPRLEVARRLHDTAGQASRDAQTQLALDICKVLYDVVKLVPALGEAAMIIELGLAAIEAMSGAVDVVCSTIDRHVYRYRSARARTLELYKIHAQQVHALRNAKDRSPHTQFRVRICAIIGLLGLIERCGSRKDPAKFAEKVHQYSIAEYIEHHLSQRKETAFLALHAGTPLDEAWLYERGNRENAWNRITATLDSENIYRELTETAWVVAKADYHENFPCYGMDADSPEALVRAFSRNFTALLDDKLVFFCVYVRKNPKSPWVRPSEADWRIGPFTAVRVVAILKSESDASGTPVSLQWKRADRTEDGPVYKTMLVKAHASADGGNDKGLLDNTDERRFINDKDAYAAVFFPFYTWKQHYVDGIKPFGHIPAGERQMEVKLSFKIGDDARNVHIEPGKPKLMVHFPQGLVYDEMLFDVPFLKHKTHTAHQKQLFVEGRVWVVGAFVPGGKGSSWIANPAYRTEPLPLAAGPEFRFGWGLPCSIVFILFGENAGVNSFPDDPIRFSAQLTLWIDNLFLDDLGPTYNLDFLSLDRRPTKVLDSAKLPEILAERRLAIASPLNQSTLHFQEPGALFAARFSPSFSIAAKGGGMIDKPGLKPFGPHLHWDESYAAGNNASHPYVFSASLRGAVGLGLEIKRALRFRLPGLQRSFLQDAAFFSRPAVFTVERNWRSLAIEDLGF